MSGELVGVIGTLAGGTLGFLLSWWKTSRDERKDLRASARLLYSEFGRIRHTVRAKSNQLDEGMSPQLNAALLAVNSWIAVASVLGRHMKDDEWAMLGKVVGDLHRLASAVGDDGERLKPKAPRAGRFRKLGPNLDQAMAALRELRGAGIVERS